jgi:hypothetical protein
MEHQDQLHTHLMEVSFYRRLLNSDPTLRFTRSGLGSVEGYVAESGVDSPRAVYIKDHKYVENANDRYNRWNLIVFPFDEIESLRMRRGGTKRVLGASLDVIDGSDDSFPVRRINVVQTVYELGLEMDDESAELTLKHLLSIT